MNGFLLVDKAKGETSFDVVRKVRREFGVKKVGHAGTLDKLATGLLLLAIGEGTKLLEYFIGLDKVYEVTAHFGYNSASYDAEGPIEPVDPAKVVSSEEILAVIEREFVGEIDQLPPKYSALKIAGKRASDRVRAGEEVVMKPRRLTIHSFELLENSWPLVKFRVHCSSGTYIRSLVYDLGQKLEVGGYVEDLRRISIGSFNVIGASESEGLDKKSIQKILPFSEIVSFFGNVDFSPEESVKLRDGKSIECNKFEQGRVFLALCNGKPVGVLEEGVLPGTVKVRKGLNLD